ncbi:response regulator [Kineococcus sp. T13]|uniref:response regulator transcription factor n=1 Tax=Kineococcus vitellinus TaxID=2696565 RepID=UPI001413713D|nr:response regulator transcription factor [Kineococcus vitellinus]NAZ77375.1 response regulator [Kineococcus vitellinus]
MSIRVLLADDENLVRSAVAGLLDLQDDLEVVAQAASCAEAVAMARKESPDVAVLDLQMPPAEGLPDGIAVAQRLHAEVPGCTTMLLTSHGRPGYLKRALEVGVRGFLPKTSSGSVLAEAIRTVSAGGRYVDPSLAADAIAAGESPLTPREADVLELAADGASVEEIALRASLSPGTVRNHLSSATGKLGAVNRHEAVVLARRSGWI